MRVGLEIEYEKTSPIIVSNAMNRDYFINTRDASVESNVKGILNRPATTNINKLLENIYLGGEVVLRNPLQLESFLSNDVQYSLEQILNILHGEENNYRSSIHVHVDLTWLGKPKLTILKNIIRMLTRSESLIYRMSGIFKEHRGINNNYNYCRPITYKGPLVFRISNDNGGYYWGQLFNTNDLLNSKTVKEFFTRYGDSYNNASWKYHPVRYHGFNLFSFLRHGSLEFRTMNFTSSITCINAMIIFFNYFTEMAVKLKYSEISKLGVQPINSLFNPNHEDNINLLAIILNKIPKEYNTYKNRLIDLFDKGSYPFINNEFYYMSHMVEKSDFVLFKNTDYKPLEIPRELILNPTYTDIHNLR